MSASSSRGASGRRTGAKLTVAVAMTVCATAGAATAATSTNKIRVSAPKRVEQKHQFKVKASGFAKASSENGSPKSNASFASIAGPSTA